MKAQIQVTGEGNYPVAPLVTVDGATFQALLDKTVVGKNSPLQPEVLVRLVWRLGVDVLARQIASGATISPAGEITHARHQRHRERAATAAATARTLRS